MIETVEGYRWLRVRALWVLASQRDGDTAQVQAQRHAAAIEGYTREELDDEVAMVEVEFGPARSDLLIARARALVATVMADAGVCDG